MKHLEGFSVKKSQKEISVPLLETPVIDTHCHLDMDAYTDDLDEILQRAYQHNIRAIISVGIDFESSTKTVSLAHKYKMVFATVGIHPHDVDNIIDTTLLMVADLAQKNKEQVVGYGEIGLDYVKKYSSPENQRRQFRNQLALAEDLRLPVIIHDREAHEDTLTILKERGPLRYGGIMHCFSGDIRFADQVLDLGLHISIPGTVTFKDADSLKEVAKSIPLSSLLLETDGPFLTPHPFRGKRNEPLYVLYTAQEIATLRDISLEELAKQTSRNAKELFTLDHLIDF
jgi:TatD DNase family protein